MSHASLASRAAPDAGVDNVQDVLDADPVACHPGTIRTDVEVVDAGKVLDGDIRGAWHGGHHLLDTFGSCQQLVRVLSHDVDGDGRVETGDHLIGAHLEFLGELHGRARNGTQHLAQLILHGLFGDTRRPLGGRLQLEMDLVVDVGVFGGQGNVAN